MQLIWLLLFCFLKTFLLFKFFSEALNRNPSAYAGIDFNIQGQTLFSKHLILISIFLAGIEIELRSF